MTKFILMVFGISLLLGIHNGVYPWWLALQAMVVVKYIVRMEIEHDKKRL